VKVICPYCDKPAPLVTGAVVYPHRPDLFTKLFYQCKPCDALVGCHPKAGLDGRGGLGDGTVPLGRLANAELRRAKQAAHTAFDPLWQSRQMSRRSAYKWLAESLGIEKKNAHIGMFDVQECRAVVAAVKEKKKGIYILDTLDGRE